MSPTTAVSTKRQSVSQVNVCCEVNIPLILTSSEATASGHKYEDITGVSYEYPAMYRNKIVEGERFAYYRGRQTSTGGRQTQVYFGTGVIGRIRPSHNRAGYFVCEISDYQPFEVPVFFKDADGMYLEVGGVRAGYFQLGVRRITESEFDRILGEAAALSPKEESGKTLAPQRRASAYASPEVAAAIEAYSVHVVQAYLAASFPDHHVDVQPHNNPGFDISVGTATEVLHYVEVKGTQAPQPRFFLSEGERLFSVQNAGKYLLVVVHTIDLVNQTHELFVHHGAISGGQFELAPVQWACGVGSVK